MLTIFFLKKRLQADQKTKKTAPSRSKLFKNDFELIKILRKRLQADQKTKKTAPSR